MNVAMYDSFGIRICDVSNVSMRLLFSHAWPSLDVKQAMRTPILERAMLAAVFFVKATPSQAQLYISVVYICEYEGRR